MDLSTLNPMQLEAVQTTEGPLLLLAGAGSGKTRALTHRIAYLIEQGLEPYNILAITFTNKAAKEMKHRVEQMIKRGNEVWISTFHATCVRILRRNAERIGFNRYFTIYDTDDQEKLMKSLLREHDLNEKQYPAKTVLHEISRAKDDLTTPEMYAKAAEDFREEKIAVLYRAYQARLLLNNAMDFDDIIVKTIELFRKNPEVLAEYQQRFLYIMVDEYQDTNTAQFELVRLLAAKYKNLCVVGDDDQSIYGWRGANIKNILDFEKSYPNATVIRLEQNYRSTGAILDAANAVIKNNKGRKQKKLWTESERGSLVKIFHAPSDMDEAFYVINSIKDRHEKGEKLANFAILYRTNAQSRLFEDRLVKLNIPYRLVGGVRFYERREIKDVLAYLRVILNPYDEISVKRIINIPRRGIGQTTLDKITAYAIANEMAFFEALKAVEHILQTKAKCKPVYAFVELIESLRRDAAEHTVSELMNLMLERTGYLLELEADTDDNGETRAENVEELISKAVQYEQDDENPTLAGFLEDVSLVADVDNLNADDDGVVLMTVHSAKGLEFPVVFLCGLEEGLFPGNRAIQSPNPNDIEEERRLCYVAITRAERELYVTHAVTRLQYGHQVYNPPSRFIKEIPVTLLEDVMKRTVKPVLEAGKRNLANADLRESVKSVNIKSEAKNYLEATISAIPAPVGVSLDFGVGDRVRQIRYGVGVVTNIAAAGADYEVTVEFPDIGAKKFMAHLSKLTKAE